jgi:hypothetical protein
VVSNAEGRFDSGRSHVRAFRRALLALGATALITVIVRLRGSGGTPPQTGGWRELSGPDLR